ncbi:MAG: hypothetical protein F6K14_10560 [Symploca sp. SIO2C1]|nr:hypothetical protein [Symploca sp. SIO2C1]
MVDLPESNAAYPPAIRQIGHGELAYGGDNTKPPNEQLLALASRTSYLKGLVDGHDAAIANLNTALNGKQDLNKVLTLLGAIASQLDDNGKLPPDKVLATDANGNFELIDKPVDGFARIIHSLPVGNIAGGLGAENTWTVVPLNTIVRNIGNIITLANSTVTIQPGEYLVEGKAFCCGVIRAQSRLRDITNGVTLVQGDSIGSTQDTFTAGAGTLTLTQVSTFCDRLTFNAQTDMRMDLIITHEHQYSASLGVNVFGTNGSLQVPTAQGLNENYSSLVFERIG